MRSNRPLATLYLVLAFLCAGLSVAFSSVPGPRVVQIKPVDVDTDGNGIWDDLDSEFAKYPAKKRVAALAFSKIFIEALNHPGPEALARHLYSLSCLSLADKDPQFTEVVLDSILFTKERYSRYQKLGEVGGGVFGLPASDEEGCRSADPEAAEQIQQTT